MIYGNLAGGLAIELTQTEALELIAQLSRQVVEAGGSKSSAKVVPAIKQTEDFSAASKITFLVGAQ